MWLGGASNIPDDALIADAYDLDWNAVGCACALRGIMVYFCGMHVSNG